VRFTRTQVRAACALSDTQARIHLERLAAMEFVLVHRGQRGQSFEYELLHDQAGTDSGPHLCGLIDVAALKSSSTTPSSRGSGGQFAGPARPLRGANAGEVRPIETAGKPHEQRPGAEMPDADPAARAAPGRVARSSYPQPLAA
jgi:hypothetical protein